MKFHKLGPSTAITNVPAGDFALFYSHGKSKIGLVVEINSQERGLIDIDHEGRDNKGYPVIFLENDFLNDKIIHLVDARIVPSFNTKHIVFQRASDGSPSKALYIKKDEIIINAARHESLYQFDVITGKKPQQTGRIDWVSTRWFVQIPDPDGNFQALAEFSI